MNDRRSMLETFRERLDEVVRRSGLNRSQFAEQAEVDRSTLSQLLSPANHRLPRIETLVSVAASQQVSLDWLLGLTNTGAMQAEMLHEQMALKRASLAPDDEQLLEWQREAVGYKIRYVPSTLPDLLKTDDVIRYEAGEHVASRPEQRIETAAARLEWTRSPETDLECCNSVQAVRGFARGEGIWRDLPQGARVAELDHMARLTEELYPTLRWFLFDGLQRYAAPITIYGPLRVALYLGQMYMVLTSADHVRALTQHFDDLIRGAVIHPHEIAAFLREQRGVASRSRH